jgi:uncharacterized protein (TIGR03382 family)
MKSLTTDDAKAFFAKASLPNGAAYLSFRTAITDSDNVPQDTKAFYELLRLTSLGSPGNDMFVRLANESLGTKLNEIPMPVAEGNHWQWAMATGDLPDALLPKAMTDGIPREALLVGYYEALDEIGLLTKAVPASPAPPPPGVDGGAPDGGGAKGDGGVGGSDDAGSDTDAGSNDTDAGVDDGTGSGSGGHGSRPPEEGDNSSEDGDAGAPQSFGAAKKSGCSATGSRPEGAGYFALAFIGLGAMLRRRKKS